MDAGTALLLKVLAQNINFSTVKRVLDVGCGTGVVALSLKARFPDLEVVAVDRDYLAVQLTRQNAQLNNLKNIKITHGLGVHSWEGQWLETGSYDLIASNVPAKAGAPVLRAWMVDFLSCLSSGGKGCVVVVSSLKESMHQYLSAAGAEIIKMEDSREYCVFLFGKGSGAQQGTVQLAPYQRANSEFIMSTKERLKLQTVYNLPEFDTLSYRTKLVLNCLGTIKVEGDVTIWNPGQGHLALALQHKYGRQINRLHLYGRDLLSLINTEVNLVQYGFPKTNLSMQGESCLSLLKESADWLFALPEINTGYQWYTDIISILPKMTNMVIAAKSAYIFRFLEKKPVIKLISDKKYNGFRLIQFVNL